MNKLYYFGTEIKKFGHYMHRLDFEWVQEEREITVPFNRESYPIKSANRTI